MHERIASLNNLGRWVWSVSCIIAFGFMATSLLVACDDGSRPTPIPVATSAQAPTASIELCATKEEATPADLDAKLADLVNGNSAFAFELYKNLMAEEGNLFFSPYSISLALAMTHAGARGETERQIAQTLCLLLPQHSLHPAFKDLGLQLASRGRGTQGTDGGGFRLNISNAVWGQEDYEFVQGFLEVLTENYGTGMKPVDFVGAPEQSRLMINDWVSGQTEGRIKDLLPSGTIDELTKLVLTNAIYFDAEWLHRFPKGFTRSRPFHLLDRGQVQVPMMSRTAEFGYARGEGYQAVDLPYHGGELSMTILLPDEGRFREFEGSLGANLAGRIVEDFEVERVLLTIPKFEFESKVGLDNVLKKMGMPNAFDKRTGGLLGDGW